MPTIIERKLYSRGLKLCARCQEILPFSTYNMRVEGGKTYCVSKCRECQKASYRDNKDEIREIRRQHRTGAPIGTYEYLVSLYGAKCAICGAENPGGTSRESGQFHIDHDHNTGLIRGLLCSTCNVGIGMLKHDISVLSSAIQYLQLEGISIDELKKRIVQEILDPAELGL